MDKNRAEVLRDEAYAKCRKGDHSWFDDTGFDGVGYKCERSFEVGDFGNIRKTYFTNPLPLLQL